MLVPILQFTESRTPSKPVIPVYVKPAANWKDTVKTFRTDLCYLKYLSLKDSCDFLFLEDLFVF